MKTENIMDAGLNMAALATLTSWHKTCSLNWNVTLMHEHERRNENQCRSNFPIAINSSKISSCMRSSTAEFVNCFLLRCCLYVEPNQIALWFPASNPDCHHGYFAFNAIFTVPIQFDNLVFLFQNLRQKYCKTNAAQNKSTFSCVAVFASAFPRRDDTSAYPRSPGGNTLGPN